MRKIILICALGAAFLLFGCNENAAQSSAAKIAVIDAQAVFEKSKVASEGIAYVDSFAPKLKELSEELLTKLDENPAYEPQIQAEYGRIQREVEAAQRQVAENVYKIFEKAVDEYRTANGIAVILQKELVVSIDPAADISDKVAEALDKTNADYKEGIAEVNFKVDLKEPEKAPEKAAE